MKRIKLTILTLLLMLPFAAKAEVPDSITEKLKGDINLFVVNDTGRNGYYRQKGVADMLGEMADAIGPEAIVAVGDIHHFNGVQSTDDPLWLTNYELIYSHPELMIDWLPVLGNHEYRGNTDAVIGYTDKSRRWEMPGRYYTKAFNHKGTTLRLVMIDTTPLIDKYRQDCEKYPDAGVQDMNRQLEWLDSILSETKEDWVIVAGHHPIYAHTSKDESERMDLQKRLDPILHKHNVDAYINGHIHNFQDVKIVDSPVRYITNSSGSLSRKVKSIEGTVFCSPSEGFSIVSADHDNLRIHMIDYSGKIIHTTTIPKRHK